MGAGGPELGVGDVGTELQRRFSTEPLESTTTRRASVGARPTSCTERMVAVSCEGAITTAA